MYIVEWEQWYRCGKYGDDKDFEILSQEFDALHKAELFKENLIAGQFRGMYDLKVEPSEVTLYTK